MNNGSKHSPTDLHADVQKPRWQTPVLSEDLIAESTRHVFGSGIDNYEATNPVAYGS